jgi:diacylglycerol kinase family enzyme
MRDTPLRWKRRVGWLAYLLPAVRNLNAPRFNANLTMDGRTVGVTARLVLLAVGAAVVHPRFRVARGIDRADGILDVLIYDPPGAIGALSCVGWIVYGTPERSRWLTHYRVRKLRLDADGPVPFEVDGDFAGPLPVDVCLLDHAVRIRVPDTFAGVSVGR